MRTLLASLVLLTAGAAASPTLRAPADAFQLQHDQGEIAAKGYDLALGRFKAGAGTLDSVEDWSRRRFDSERTTATAATAADDYLRRSQALEKTAKEGVSAGIYTNETYLLAQWYRLDAELAVARAAQGQ